MSRSVAATAKIFSAIIKSLFFSGMIFIIFFSIVTGGFPPDFRKLSRAFNGAQELRKTSQISSANFEHGGVGFDDEKDVATLEAYHHKRAKLGENLFGSSTVTEEEEERIVPLRQISSAEATDDLKLQLRDMQQEIFRLQQRVNELEEQTQKRHK